jgi:hypothetical protein
MEHGEYQNVIGAGCLWDDYKSNCKNDEQAAINIRE